MHHRTLLLLPSRKRIEYFYLFIEYHLNSLLNFRERTYDHVKIEWRPAAAYGKINVIGYKIFINNRLAAILSDNQLSYTLMKGLPCETYTVHVQALSSDSKIVSPMSRSIQFLWPGIKPGAFRRVDDGQSSIVMLKWDNPTFEDKAEKLLGYKVRFRSGWINYENFRFVQLIEL